MSVKHASLNSLVIILLLSLFALGSSHPLWTADISSQTFIAKSTPFDRKLMHAGIFMNDSNASFHSPSPNRSLPSLFMTAKAFRYTTDKAGDKWQTSRETEMRRSGDCEDKAVWLYTQLKKNGYSDARIVVGKYRNIDRGYHVWVVCTDDNGSLALLDPAMQKRIWQAGDFSSGFYRAIYSYDGKNRYRHAV